MDDQRIFADALALAIEMQPDMRAWSAAHSAEEAIEQLRFVAAENAEQPDVVLLDINLPGMDGTTAISELRTICPDVRIVVITAELTGEALLLLLADGIPVKQIARRLDMSVHTCCGHVSALLGKLDAHSQLSAVITAARLGLLPNLRANG